MTVNLQCVDVNICFFLALGFSYSLWSEATLVDSVDEIFSGSSDHQVRFPQLSF